MPSFKVSNCVEGLKTIGPVTLKLFSKTVLPFCLSVTSMEPSSVSGVIVKLPSESGSTLKLASLPVISKSISCEPSNIVSAIFVPFVKENFCSAGSKVIVPPVTFNSPSKAVALSLVKLIFKPPSFEPGVMKNLSSWKVKVAPASAVAVNV